MARIEAGQTLRTRASALNWRFRLFAGCLTHHLDKSAVPFLPFRFLIKHELGTRRWIRADLEDSAQMVSVLTCSTRDAKDIVARR